MLGVVVAAYRNFSDRVETLVTSGLSKPERVAELIKNTYGEITKSQIMEKCPDISRITVEKALSELLSSESIIKIGGGSYFFVTIHGSPHPNAPESIDMTKMNEDQIHAEIQRGYE